MQLDELRALYDREQRIDMQYPDARREATPTIVRHVLTTGRKSGWVLWSNLDETTVDTAIEAEIAYFEGIGYGFEWKVFSHDAPPDLKARLIARGFTPEEPPDAIMVLDLQADARLLHEPVPASIRRLTDPADVDGIVTMLGEVWRKNFTRLGNDLRAQMITMPDFISIYAAVEDGRTVSAAWTHHTAGQFSGLWGGSTLPEYRRRGLYTGLLAARATEALARGKRFLTVDASPMSRPILEKFGFVCIAEATACHWGQQD